MVYAILVSMFLCCFSDTGIQLRPTGHDAPCAGLRTGPTLAANAPDAQWLEALGVTPPATEALRWLAAGMPAATMGTPLMAPKARTPGRTGRQALTAARD